MAAKSPKDTEAQRKRFEQAARELGCDEDEASFNERLNKVAAQKPVSDPPTPPNEPKTEKPGQ